MDSSLRVLRRWETGRQVTEVMCDDSGALWWSRAAEPASDHFALEHRSADAERRVLDSLSRGNLVFVLPERSIRENRVAWQAFGTVSAAEVLVPGAAAGSALFPEWRDVGSALASFHERMAEVTADLRSRTAPGLLRLRSWMASSDLVGPSAAWHREFSRIVGFGKWKQLQEAIDHLCARADSGSDVDAVPLHGWFSLGNLVLPDDPERPTAILGGAESCWGKREYDLGTIAGELIEYGYLASLRGEGDRPYRKMLSDIVSGYGPVDPTILRFAVVARILTHACDFADYVGWSHELAIYGQIVDELMDAGDDWLEQISFDPRESS